MEEKEEVEEKKPLFRSGENALDFEVVTTYGNWKTGDDVIVLPPATQEVAEKHLQEGCGCIDWFLCKKKLSAQLSNF